MDHPAKRCSFPLRKKPSPDHSLRNPSRGRVPIIERSLNLSIKAFEQQVAPRMWLNSEVKQQAGRVKSASQSRYQSPMIQKQNSQSPAGARHKRGNAYTRPISSQKRIESHPSRVHSANTTPKRGLSTSFLQLRIDSRCDIKRANVAHKRDLSLEVKPSNSGNSSGETIVRPGRGASVESRGELPGQEQKKEERDRLIKYLKKYYVQKHTLPTTSSDYYHFLKLIGKGAFGKVSLAVHKLTGLHVAIKSLDKAYIKDERTRRKVFNEVINMRKINHLHVVRLFEVFESSRHFNMVLEYCGGGDLLHFVKSRGKLPESEAKMIFYQVTEAVAACHNRGIIHRDVKLDNVLMDSSMTTAKLCDFGVSRPALRGQRINDQCGTPAYIAPEIIVDCGYDGFYVDLWSMGVLLYAMVVGTVPFRASTLPELHKLILKGKYTMPGTLSGEVQQLITGLLQLVPQNRMQLEDILAHSWFAKTIGETEVAEKMTSRFVGRICSHGPGHSADPIDQHLISQLEQYGLPGEYAWHCLRLSEINHATATYELLQTSQNPL